MVQSTPGPMRDWVPSLELKKQTNKQNHRGTTVSHLLILCLEPYFSREHHPPWPLNLCSEVSSSQMSSMTMHKTACLAPFPALLKLSWHSIAGCRPHCVCTVTAETSEQALSFSRCREAVSDLQPTHPVSIQPGLAWVEWEHQTAPWGKTHLKRNCPGLLKRQ